MFRDFGEPEQRRTSALGSGFIINNNGTVVTNNHVIQGAEDIFVTVNGKEYEAEIIGSIHYLILQF